MKRITLHQHTLAPQYNLDRVKLSIQRGPLGGFDRPDGERLLLLWNLSCDLTNQEIEELFAK